MNPKDIQLEKYFIDLFGSRGPSLYRVRTEFVGEKESISSFSYIPDAKTTTRFRFNKKGEQVLYTSTTPVVAVKETLPDTTPGHSSCFYISKWRKKSEKSFKSFVSVNDDCSKDPASIARKVRNELCRIFSPLLKEIDELSTILEKDYSGCPDDEKYIESSELASKIFQKGDCIASYSAHDDKELNITLNKKAVDANLELDTVYHCGPQKDYSSLYFDVKEIGRVENGKIKWYTWEIDESSIKLVGKKIDDLMNIDKIRNILKTERNCVGVNLNVPIDGIHLGLVEYRGQRYQINYRIHLVPIK